MGGRTFQKEEFLEKRESSVKEGLLLYMVRETFNRLSTEQDSLLERITSKTNRLKGGKGTLQRKSGESKRGTSHRTAFKIVNPKKSI